MALDPDEERRAELWRTQCERRASFRQTLAARLAGNPAERAKLDEQWAPLISAINERDSSCDEGED